MTAQLMGSWDELKSVHANNEHVKIISFSRNFGQIPGIICGWKEAKGDAVINMSADLQDPVEQAIEMIKNWLAGDEIVISYRIARNDSFFTNLTSKIFYALMKNNVPKMPLGGFDFCTIRQKSSKRRKPVK
jgi:glycosyltransferase involved in cell wall biosynthesis